MTTWADVRPGDRILGKDGSAWEVETFTMETLRPGVTVLRVEMHSETHPVRHHAGSPQPDAEVTILTRHHPQNTEADAVRLITDTFGGTVHDPCPHCNGTGVIA